MPTPPVYRAQLLGGFADGYVSVDRKIPKPAPKRIWICPVHHRGGQIYRGCGPLGDFDHVHCMFEPTQGYEPYKLREVKDDGDKPKNWIEQGIGGTLVPIAVYEHADMDLDTLPGESVGVDTNEREAVMARGLIL